jgi:hypothetical protein
MPHMLPYPKNPNIHDILHYMDDAWSYDLDSDLHFYKPYNVFCLGKQVQLLMLWDEIGLPHEKAKQLYAPSLDIIRFHVDPSQMMIQMSQDSCLQLIEVIEAFVNSATTQHRPLVEWQQLLGWIDWALIAFPLLKPGLASSYVKIAGKEKHHAPVYLNVQVSQDLRWVASMLQQGTGISLLTSIAWGRKQANTVIYCDASLSGLGFFIPSLNLGFASPIPDNIPSHDILFLEALCVISAIFWASQQHSPPQHLLIFTDSLDTVKMFHLLKAKPTYNFILLVAVRILI